MNSQTVYHNWAHQTPKSNGALEARAGNCSYSGEYAYSYAAPIARRIPFGSEVVWLLTTRSYSVTTSKHVRYAWRAIPLGAGLVFDVPRLDVENADAHVENLRCFSKQVTETLEKARRARKLGPWLLERANSLRESWERYCRVFGLDFDCDLPAELSPERIAETIAQVEWSRVAPAADSLGLTREAFGAMSKVERERVTLTAKALAHESNPESDSLRSWRAGSSVLPGSSEFDAMRYSAGDLIDSVQTARGVSVPVCSVREALPAALRACESMPLGSESAPGSVGGYVMRIGRGYVRVGCHTFTLAELRRLARELPSPVSC